jgi:peptidoglycan/LPS O-acetylase OafA/YrhL
MADVTEQYTRPKHIPALDGVRFLAVGLVILHHITSGSHSSIFLHLIGLQEGNGLGPTLFFVLSGVLLTPVILNARNTEHRYRNFLLRRVLRIFPLYFAYLAVAAVATVLLTGHRLQHLWVFAFFLQNAFLTAAGQTGSVMPMYHLWTLALQDQFYIFWPLLLWNCDSTRAMRRACYVIILLSFASRVVITHPSLTPDLFGRILPARAGEMCLGALLALDLREKGSFANLLRRSFLPIAAVLFLWMWHGLSFLTPLGSTVGIQLITLASAALIATAVQPHSWAARLLGSRFMALGGKKYAFAMYMFHPLCLITCLDLPIASKAVRLALFGISTVVVSGLSYRFYESPFLHMKVGRTQTSQPPRPVQQTTSQQEQPSELTTA